MKHGVSLAQLPAVRITPFVPSAIACSQNFSAGSQLTRSRELFTLSVLAAAPGLAVSSATLFGASMALGAFLAGMIVNQSAYSHRAAIEALPMRGAFAVLFFVSVEMLFNP